MTDISGPLPSPVDLGARRHVWTARGGVAVTTYDALRAMPVADGLTLGMLTVDEAHYMKGHQAENERRIVELERKRLRMEEAEREGGDGLLRRPTAGRVLSLSRTDGGFTRHRHHDCGGAWTKLGRGAPHGVFILLDDIGHGLAEHADHTVLGHRTHTR